VFGSDAEVVQVPCEVYPHRTYNRTWAFRRLSARVILVFYRLLQSIKVGPGECRRLKAMNIRRNWAPGLAFCFIGCVSRPGRDLPDRRPVAPQVDPEPATYHRPQDSSLRAALA
jgi:hypothetical protein